MDTMQWIVVLVLGLLLIGFGFFFAYKYLWGSAETMSGFTPDEAAQAKQQCELACSGARLARSCQDWQKKYCERAYLTSTCGDVDGKDIAKCESPARFGDGSMGEDCSCGYQLL